MSEHALRARTVPELIDATFSLYRRDASTYIMVTAIAAVPGLIAQLLFMRAESGASLLASAGGIFVFLVSMVTYALMSGVVIKVGSDVYLGGRADVASAVRHVRPMIGILIVTALYKAVLYFLHALALFFPVLIAFAKYFAPEAAVVLEGKSAGEAMSRSVALSEGIRRHIFRALVLGYGIYFLLGIALGALGIAVENQVVLLFLETIFTIVAYPIVGLLTMLLYYDARIRKEGFDVEHLAQRLDAPGATPLPAR